MAAAQERPDPVAEFAGGALFFPDDDVVTEGVLGGAVRFYLRPRISIGPEIAYVSGEGHSHLMLTGNLTFDFLRPAGGAPHRVTRFAVAGGGLFRTRESLPGNASFTSTEGAFTAGGGIRALVGRRVTVGVEARVGWELHVRLNGLIGVRFGNL